MKVQQHTRNATLEDLAALLTEQHAAKLDLVVPATNIRCKDGRFIVADAYSEPSIDPDGTLGMSPVPGVFVPTAVADEHIATKFGIPLPYLRRMRTERPDMFDANVNGWLHGRRKHIAPGNVEVIAPPDSRRFLLRTFRGNGDPGVLRAMVSDRFRTIDNLDVLVAALDGVREAGAAVTIDGCDLTDRRMYVRITAPEIKAMAPALLANYRSPFGGGIERIREMAAREGMGYDPGAEPVVFAGLVISNSETGGGAFTITPRLQVRICKNGLTITADALREVHLGGKLEEGVVEWSDETNKRALQLVTSKARDAVSTFLNPTYLEQKVAEFTSKAGVPVADAAKAVEVVTNRLRLSDATGKAVLDHFIRAGQVNVGGIMQAVSSVAQVTSDADAAADLEAMAVKVLDMAYSL